MFVSCNMPKKVRVGRSFFFAKADFVGKIPVCKKKDGLKWWKQCFSGDLQKLKANMNPWSREPRSARPRGEIWLKPKPKLNVHYFVISVRSENGGGDDDGPSMCDVVKGTALLALCGMLLWCWLGKGKGSGSAAKACVPCPQTGCKAGYKCCFWRRKKHCFSARKQ